MQVAVWDTYVTRKDDKVMHFDIIVPDTLKDENVIYNYGKEYLKTKGQEGQSLTSTESKYCHTEEVKTHWEADIRERGYYIYEMENCD
ncbi:MAG: DUF2024 family protein [Bacteroidia bacterium]|nr:DUF2024 family protein [Bacteroidia bacterium]